MIYQNPRFTSQILYLIYSKGFVFSKLQRACNGKVKLWILLRFIRNTVQQTYLSLMRKQLWNSTDFH